MSPLLQPPGAIADRAGSRAVAPPVERDRAAGRRFAAALIFAACGGVIATAAWMTPDASGLGTHRQLGLPPCGWIAGLDMPCPTCGMTTAFAAAADGNFAASFRAQPFGLLLAIVTGMTAVVAGYVALTGSALGGYLVGLLGRRVAWFTLVAALAAWFYRIATHKGLLS